MKKGKMHISQIPRAVHFVSMMSNAIPVKFVYWGQADAFSESGMGIFRVHRVIKVWDGEQ